MSKLPEKSPEPEKLCQICQLGGISCQGGSGSCFDVFEFEVDEETLKLTPFEA